MALPTQIGVPFSNGGQWWTTDRDGNWSVATDPNAAPELNYFGTAGNVASPVTALDNEGNPVGGPRSPIVRGEQLWVQIGNPADTGLYAPGSEGARFVVLDPSYGAIVPAELNQSLVNKANAASGDPIFKALDAGVGFWLLTAGAGALIAGAAVAGAGNVASGATGAFDAGLFTATDVGLNPAFNAFGNPWGAAGGGGGTFSSGGSVFDSFFDVGGTNIPEYNPGLLEEGFNWQPNEFTNIPAETAAPYQPGYNFYDPSTYSGSFGAGTSLDLLRSAAQNAAKSAGSSTLQQLARSILGAPTQNPAGSVMRPGAQNYVFLPGGGAAGGGYFPGGPGALDAMDMKPLLWVALGVGLILLFANAGK